MSHYLVTGAASGIGRALAQRLLDAGHEVTSWDRATHGVTGAVHRSLDLTDAIAVDAAAADLPADLAGLVNVAGVPGTAPATTVLDVNVRATINVTRVVTPRLSGGGAVVTVASIAGLRAAVDDRALDLILSSRPVDEVAADLALDGPAAYDASKKALWRWNSRLVAELLGRGVRACTVSPGPVQTPILHDFEQTMGESLQRSVAALTRHATPDEVATAVAFLLSPTASWINGVDLRVDGGLVALASAAPSTIEVTS